jgi:hypothetical protein
VRDRRFTDRDLLFGIHTAGTFDAVVMCNVLHEIDPRQWPSLFDNNGLVYRALNATGKLIIVEDYLMPKGEYAHPYGFIVLNTEALAELFGAGDGDNKILPLESEGRYFGRIRAHVVPRHLLTNATPERRTVALELCASKAVAEIRRLREEDIHSFRSGQAHAFWVQQLANTTLALKEL